MAKLYELVEQIERFEFEIDEETGEILNADELDKLELERDTKIENISLWIKNLKADAAAYKAEKESFAAKEKAANNKMESLKNYLQYTLNGEKFKTNRVQVTFGKRDSVHVTDASLLTEDLLRFRDPEPNKTAIAKAIKEGRHVEGAEIVTNQYISIK